MVVEIRVHVASAIKAIDGMIEINKKKVQKSLVALGNDCIKNAKANLKPGKLRRSIGNVSAEGVYELSSNRLVIGTKVPYSVLVERGVSHSWMIPKRPKAKGKWLKFYWEKVGHIIFAKQVVHPPMKGKFFMTRAAIKTAKNAPRILAKI